METSSTIDANQQAYQLQLSFERRAQLLTLICNERLAIEHYRPDVSEKRLPSDFASELFVSYCHFSYHINPLKRPAFMYKGTTNGNEIAFEIGCKEILQQLKEFQADKTPDEKACEETRHLTKSYMECAKFLSLICNHQLAIADYVPKVRILPDVKTGHTYFGIDYQHKYFISRGEKDRKFEFESSSINQDFTIEDCMNQVIGDIRTTTPQ